MMLFKWIFYFFDLALFGADDVIGVVDIGYVLFSRS